MNKNEKNQNKIESKGNSNFKESNQKNKYLNNNEVVTFHSNHDDF
jgi:hypothetical protein